MTNHTLRLRNRDGRAPFPSRGSTPSRFAGKVIVYFPYTTLIIFVSMRSHILPFLFWRCLFHVLAVILFAATLEKAQANLVLSNVPANSNGGTTLNATDYKALLFTSGPDATEIVSLALGLNPISSSNIPSTAKVEISLWSTTLNATVLEPDVQLATTGLQTVNMSSLQGLYTFQDAFFGGGFSMAAQTSYALILTSDASGIKWANKNHTSPVGSSGFTYNNFLGSSNAGADWTTAPSMHNAVSMEVNIVPEPSTAMLFCTIAGFVALCLRNRDARAPLARAATPESNS
jgi:hypothetical protein